MSEPREDVEALKRKIEDALAATQDMDAVHALDALLSRLEQTKRERNEALEAMSAAWNDTNAAERERDKYDDLYEAQAKVSAQLTSRAEAAERALREIKTYTESCRDNYGFPSTVRLLDITDAALASSEGEKKRVLINTRTGERREWEPGLVLQAEGPLEWELREE